MNLLEQQAANRRRTWVVMAIFIAFLALLGAGVDAFVIGHGRAFVPIATPIAVLFGSGQAWWSLRSGDQAVLKSTRAIPVQELIDTAETDDDKLRYRQFQNVVEEMAIAAGVPAPKAFVVPDPDPNAFATGRDPQHASVAATEGLLRRLNREQLQGVIAHELGHVRNLDIRLMTVVAALVGAILLLADFSARAMWFGGVRGGRSRRGGRDGDGAGVVGILMLVFWILAIVLAPIIGQLLATAVSRRREYLADATGAELTRNPLSLASALETIENAAEPTKSIKRGTAHMCIADPTGRKLNQSESAWSNLWATHPPMARRIARLREMAYQR